MIVRYCHLGFGGACEVTQWLDGATSGNPAPSRALGPLLPTTVPRRGCNGPAMAAASFDDGGCRRSAPSTASCGAQRRPIPDWPLAIALGFWYDQRYASHRRDPAPDPAEAWAAARPRRVGPQGRRLPSMRACTSTPDRSRPRSSPPSSPRPTSGLPRISAPYASDDRPAQAEATTPRDRREIGTSTLDASSASTASSGDLAGMVPG